MRARGLEGEELTKITLTEAKARADAFFAILPLLETPRPDVMGLAGAPRMAERVDGHREHGTFSVTSVISSVPIAHFVCDPYSAYPVPA